MKPSLQVILAKPRGFCAGVDRAIATVQQALAIHGAPLYVRHEVVHNRHVVQQLARAGAVFVDTLAQIPAGQVVVLSAHGVARDVHEEAKTRGLRVIDATCPLVTKVHLEVASYTRKGYDVVLIGHRGHVEVQGTMGHAEPPGRVHLISSAEEVASLAIDPGRPVAYATQTTLSVSETAAIVAALQYRFPELRAPRRDDICYASENRQQAVRLLARRVQQVLVIGSVNSSNTQRLVEIARSEGCAARRIDGEDEISCADLQGIATLGITAGASAPESLLQAVLARLTDWRAVTVSEMDGITETMAFALPRAVRRPASQATP